MDREILFRGQTRKRGEKVRMDGTPVDGNWVYGGIFQGSSDFSIIYGSTDPDNISVSNIEKHVVHTDTVGQYTGLTDKNGVKIFEGDIVFISEWEEITDVYWRLGAWLLRFRDSDEFLSETAESCEVIGNVYDNPKLIGGEDDG